MPTIPLMLSFQKQTQTNQPAGCITVQYLQVILINRSCSGLALPVTSTHSLDKSVHLGFSFPKGVSLDKQSVSSSNIY